MIYGIKVLEVLSRDSRLDVPSSCKMSNLLNSSHVFDTNKEHVQRARKLDFRVKFGLTLYFRAS